MLLLATDPAAPRKHTSTWEQALVKGFNAISNLTPKKSHLTVHLKHLILKADGLSHG